MRALLLLALVALGECDDGLREACWQVQAGRAGRRNYEAPSGLAGGRLAPLPAGQTQFVGL